MNRHHLIRHREGDDRGFSRVELLVVIVILGILSAVVIFAVRGSGDKGQEAATATDERIANGGSASSTSSTLPATTSWVAQSSGVTSTTLYGVDCFDVTTCVAVGEGGTIVRTVDGGASWSKEESGVTRELRGVSCAAAKTCIATGVRGTILKRQELPDTPLWTPQKFSGTGTIVGLYAVDCPTTDSCFAVGSPPPFPDDSGEQVEPTIIASTDGGSTWKDQVGLSQQRLQDVSCLDGQSCISSGEYGSILITKNGGALWTTTHSGFGTDVGGEIYVPGSTCMSADVCLAITSGSAGSGWRIMRSTSGGTAWPTSDTIKPPSPDTALDAVRCADNTNCFIAGGIFGGAGKIFSSADAGLTWTTDSIPSGFDNFLYTVSCVAGTTKCWAVGTAGSILMKAS